MAVMNVITSFACVNLLTGGFFSLRIEGLRNEKARTGRATKKPLEGGLVWANAVALCKDLITVFPWVHQVNLTGPS